MYNVATSQQDSWNGGVEEFIGLEEVYHSLELN
jgi:hypothetical protein